MSSGRAPSGHNSPLEPVSSTLDVPPSQLVVLLGPRDAHLTLIERAFPDVDIHVRGTQMTLTGAAGDLAQAEGAVLDLLRQVESGVMLTRDDVSRTLALTRADPTERARS